MKDPVKAARWVARTSFQSKVAQARPAPPRDTYSSFGSTRSRGRGIRRGAVAKQNRRASQTSSGFESESQGELNPQTILEWGSGSEPSRSRDPANPRG